jgi:hypothetical protein
LGVYTTNDVPGCPKGGLLSGTNGQDFLRGEQGDDEVRGFGAIDELFGGVGSDVIYGGAGGDFVEGGRNDDVLHGGDGAEFYVVGGKGKDVIRGGMATTSWAVTRERTSSMAGTATIISTHQETGSGISSIAVKAGTTTLRPRSTMCRTIAR